MHLHIAEALKAYQALRPPDRRLIADHFAAFCLGNVAPDFQTICDVPRSETHFYTLPPESGNKAYPKMLLLYPDLTSNRVSGPDHAAFIAGYCAHLMLDLLWYHEVLIPYFVQSKGWESHRRRFLIHNALLAYLDRQAVKSLPVDMVDVLAAAEPKDWLPFAPDHLLILWRDMLVEQMRPGAGVRTIEIYARRMSIEPEDLAPYLEDHMWMDDNLLKMIQIEKIKDMLEDAIGASAELVSAYLSGETLVA